MSLRIWLLALLAYPLTNIVGAADAHTQVRVSKNEAWAQAKYRADYGSTRTHADSGDPGSAHAFAAGHDYNGDTAVSYSFLNRQGRAISLGSSARTGLPTSSNNARRYRVGNSRRVDALWNLGRGDGYLQQSNYSAAIAEYTAAIQNDPAEAEAYYMRGLARAKDGDQRGAEADFAKANQLSKAGAW